MGQVDRAEFLRRKYPVIAWTNEHLPPASRILYIGEDRPYFALQGVVYESGFGQGALSELLLQPGNPAELRTRLEKAGVTHVLLNRSLWNCNSRRFFYLRARHPAALELFLGTYTRPLFHVPYVPALTAQGSPYSAQGTVYEIRGALPRGLARDERPRDIHHDTATTLASTSGEEGDPSARDPDAGAGGAFATGSWVQ